MRVNKGGMPGWIATGCPMLLALVAGTALLATPALAQKKPRKAPAETPPVSGENIVTTEGLLNLYRQIVIEGLVVEVDSSEVRRWGIEMLYQRNDAKAPTNNFAGAVLHNPNTFPIGGVPIFQPGSDPPVGIESERIGAGMTFDSFETDTWLFQARVRAAVMNGKARILSQPIAVARSGSEVHLTTAEEIPFLDIRPTGYQVPELGPDTDNLATVSPDFFNKKAGITLKVTPQFRPPSRVQLDITELNVGQLAGFVQVRGVARPVIQNSTVTTEVELANDESLLISGIKITSEGSGRRGVPVLKDLPILGLLFGENTVVVDRQDILFMITPHVLAPGQNPIMPKDFKNQGFSRTL